jgi:glucose-6-phosphate isomerase
MVLKNPEIRYLYDIKRVLYDQKWLKEAPNFEIYYMYRGVGEKDGLRYDITIIPPRMLGKEFVKTKGHYHIGNYGEIYKVLEGEGIFLMQKKEDGKIKDIYWVKAKKGDYIVVPPRYGHTTINPSSKILKMANWISKKCQSDYKNIERKRGFCYYYTKLGWIKNKNYDKIPKLRFKKPFKTMPKNLDFLN